MQTSDFSFDLPEELIAQEPGQQRDASRLMVLDRATGGRVHSRVSDIVDHIEPGSVMVFNNSRVRKARIYGQARDTGREQEFLLVRRRSADTWLAIGRQARKLGPGRRFDLSGGVEAEIVGTEDPYRVLQFSKPIDNSWLEQHGHMPLPPYIHRSDTREDAERYQTVYSQTVGSVAAPTAGLHFTPELMDSLRARGVTIVFVTLHVGIGTFLPVRTSQLEDHVMHEEEYHVSPATANIVTDAVRGGRPVIGVGTTVVRTLESAWDQATGQIIPGHRSTDLFIYPGFEFRVIRHLFTNFHTPGSTLVALVSAFAGREFILESYREAVEHRYRFFSYGDAMLIR